MSVYLSISAILRLVEQIKSCTIVDNVVLKPGQGKPRSLFNSCHSKSLMGSISEGISQSAVLWQQKSSPNKISGSSNEL